MFVLYFLFHCLIHDHVCMTVSILTPSLRCAGSQTQHILPNPFVYLFSFGFPQACFYLLWSLMSNNYGSAGVASSSLTNNPFIDHTASTMQRFPDISQPPHVVVPNQSTGWGNGNVQQFAQQPSQFQNQMHLLQQPLPLQPNMTNATGMSMVPAQQPQPTGFQIQGSFGQGAPTGTSYSYLTGTGQPSIQQQQLQTTYHPVQQQLQNPGYISQLDPYPGIQKGWGETTTTTTAITTNFPPTTRSSGTQYFPSSNVNTPVSTQLTSLSAAGDQHPRDYINTHKMLIESWDKLTWNTFLDLFERLKNTWEARKRELEVRMGVLNTQVSTLQMQTEAAGSLGYAGYLQVQQYQQEASRIQEVSTSIS